MSDTPELIFELAPVTEAKETSALPAGTEWAGESELAELQPTDNVMFECRFIERQWLNARVLCVFDTHSIVALRDMKKPDGSFIVFELPHNCVAAVQRAN
jgi:hypothetical protein